MYYGKDELNFSLVDKKDSHKKDRLLENLRIKSISNNPKDFIEIDDDEPFFSFDD